MNATPTQQQTPRTGFTLVELLVVITVIALLIALVGAALSSTGQQAKEAATMTTIKKLHALLEQRTEAFDRQLNRTEGRIRLDQEYNRAENRAGNLQGFSASGSVQDILVRKYLRMQNFPQRFVELGDWNGDGTLDIVEQFSSDPQINYDSTKHVAVTESAELLYYMLTHMQVGDSPPVDAGEFLSRETADTDEDGLLEFVDAWGNPLRFYRWPTRLLKSDGSTHDESIDHPNLVMLIQGFSDDLVDSDPDDPVGLLSGILNNNFTASDFENIYHTMNTYHLPLIVSAGPDGELGLGEPYEQDVGDSDPDIVNFGYLAQPNGDMSDAIERDRVVNELSDNITNRNQRTGD